MEAHAIFRGVVDLSLIRRHFILSPAIDNRDFMRAHTQRCSGGIDSGVATADNGDPFADWILTRPVPFRSGLIDHHDLGCAQSIGRGSLSTSRPIGSTTNGWFVCMCVDAIVEES